MEDQTEGNVRAPIKRRQGAYLPHWTRDGAIYAVTFRLADALPASVLKKWLFERDNIIKRAQVMGRRLSGEELQRLQALHSERVERYLDAGHGMCWLRDQRVASLVKQSLLHFEGERYELVAWCIMPNHVHVIVQPLAGHELPGILHSWKSFSSIQANRLLKRRGTFWQTEYYDRLIRDREELSRQVRYVLHNPAAAGLRDWPWCGQVARASSP